MRLIGITSMFLFWGMTKFAETKRSMEKDEKDIQETGAPATPSTEGEDQTLDGAALPETEPENANGDGSGIEDVRGQLEETLRERYGEDADYSDDEVFYRGIADLLEERGVKLAEADEALAGWQDLDERMRSAIEKDSRAGQFFANVLDGMDIIDNLMDIAGPELADAVNSPEARAKIDELKAKAAEVEAARQANEEESQRVIDTFSAEKGEEETDSFGKWINAMLDDFQEGKITREALDALWKGYTYDDAVAESEIRGRNANIVAKKQSFGAGDGVPNLGEGGERLTKPKAQRRPPRNIWEGAGLE